jgi:hypothetical protein
MSGTDATPSPAAGKPRRRHGRHALTKLLLKVPERVDGRSSVAVLMRMERERISRELGGDLSRQQEIILDLAIRKLAIALSVEDWLARQETLVTKKRTLVPVARDFFRLTESVERSLALLGLERKPKPAESLDEVLRRAARREARERRRRERAVTVEAETSPAEP